MNKVYLIIIIILSSIMVTAQMKKLGERGAYNTGDFEVSISASTGICDVKTTNTSNSDIIYFSPENNDRKFYLDLGAALGYYITSGLSIEPELVLQVFENPTVHIAANLSYTFNSRSGNIYPYLKAGYGITDFKDKVENNAGLFQSLNYHLINLGAGLKLMQSYDTAFKLELNYRLITGKESLYFYYDDSVTNMNTSISILSLSFGYSFSL